MENIKRINIQALRRCMDHYACRLMKTRAGEGKKKSDGRHACLQGPPAQATGFTSGQRIGTSQIS